MANKRLKKVPVNKQEVMLLLHDKGFSIRGLGHPETGIKWSEKTIRRGLNDGFMTLDLVDAIAKHIDVDPNVISESFDIGLNTYHKIYLTQEEIEWLQVGRNLKRLSVKALIEDLELGGHDDNEVAFDELHKIYKDDEDEDEE